MASSSPFYFHENNLYCEDICLEKLLESLPEGTKETLLIDENNRIEVSGIPTTPSYIYSSKALEQNVQNYLDAMKKFSINGRLGYAVKANGNIQLLKLLKSYGVQLLVTVSGNEILAGLKSGFKPQNILLNGNGKQSWEIKLAVEQGVILNVDSITDAKRIAKISAITEPPRKVQVLLRLRPSPDSCEVGVHPYVNTSSDSKFGFGLNELDQVVDVLVAEKSIKVLGIHCHLGSCIVDPHVYSYIGNFISSASKLLENRGIEIELCDVGGGISIDYHKTLPGFSNNNHNPESNVTAKIFPPIEEYVKVIGDVIPKNCQLLIEPGRSLVGNAGIIATKVLASKNLATKSYMVVDAAMTELIRPALYQSFHQIYPVTLDGNPTEWKKYEVVGPVCESADFLGKDIQLPETPSYLAIMDCGAYSASMASNYNMRAKPTEILVTGNSWKYIRERENFEDLVNKTVNLNQPC